MEHGHGSVFITFIYGNLSVRVSECTECKMPVSNLARVFGPTIVGYSSAEAEPMKMFAETTKQAKVCHVRLHRVVNCSSYGLVLLVEPLVLKS